MDAKGRAVRLQAAFDEARFGASRTLNLRESLPTTEQAVARTESWLRERQMARAGEVLVITGRGNASPGGISPVRDAVQKLLASLRRRGVLTSIDEHTAGSFVVRLAPVSKLFEAPQSRRHPVQPLPPDPRALAALDQGTRRLLRTLAERTLDSLAMRAPLPSIVAAEMEKQFSILSAGLGDAVDREAALRAAIQRAIDELDEI